VLTGSQTPLTDVRTDARTNLVDACHLATMHIPEVGIAFNSRLLRGCRATKLDAWGMSAFGSPSCPPLAELGLGVQLGPHILDPRPLAPFDPRIEPRVLAVRTFPGLDPLVLRGALAAGVRGMVIEAFGAGNVPHLENSLIPVIKSAQSRDVPVVIVSQSPRGRVDLSRYEGGSEAARAGAIGAGDMTSEAALAKLMVTLGRAGRDPAKGRAPAEPSPGIDTRIRAAREAFAAASVGEMS
jgi:L-asparaginase